MTGGKLVNPAQDEKKGTSLVTPISEQNKDDLAYLAEGDKPANMSPEGAGRSGAFNEAKRNSGIPVSKHPDRVTPNYDRRGKLQPGKNYEFDMRDENGKIKTLII
ncbi:hypothetical protein IFT35_01540 [Pantoea agglomerans]|uniref:hypothetical protein n=1 Tax=Enterobacter agglomerans TaxID=549 RepID=UPI00177F6123|nr:hypothetical protein [Pantoea agglomerans]MBD8195599.1 hypothetical protein [Pantoea agglomerans]